MSMPTNRRITMIGFGEAARAFVAGWGQAAPQIAAYDIKDAGSDSAIAAAAEQYAVRLHDNPAPALDGAQLAFCLVTADQALAAAGACAPFVPPGLVWFDGNSCSPGSKRAAGAIISAAGGHYVDMAIMAPVHPRLNRTPALLSGEHAAASLELLDGLDMNIGLAGAYIGDASTIKMLRSVMIKGLEALSAECLLAARRAGVEDAVLASLQQSDPGFDWLRKGAYNLERMLVHGTRRAAEMQEVARTLRELGLPDRMALAAADWQAQLGALAVDVGQDDLPHRLDAILAALP